MVVWATSWLICYNLNPAFSSVIQGVRGTNFKRIKQLKEVALRMDEKVTMEEKKNSQATKTQSSIWNKFMMFMTSPADPSNLAVLRIMFGKVFAAYFFLCVHSRILLIWFPNIGHGSLTTCLVLIIHSSPGADFCRRRSRLNDGRFPKKKNEQHRCKL